MHRRHGRPRAIVEQRLGCRLPEGPQEKLVSSDFVTGHNRECCPSPWEGSLKLPPRSILICLLLRGWGLSLYHGHTTSKPSPVQDGRQRYSHCDSRNRSAELNHQSGHQNTSTDKELPFHFHTMTKNNTNSIPMKTSAGFVKGLSHVI